MKTRLVIALLALTSAFLLPRPAEAGVSWQSGSVEDALKASAKADRATLLYFTAAWCPSCQDLEREVLSTSAGARATGSMSALKIDVDAAGGEDLVTRYVILAYPSALVIGPEGHELGRVVGFDGPKDWTSALARLRDAGNSLEDLRAAQRAQPNAARPALTLGRALLERGQAKEGEGLLQEVTLRWPESDAAAEALWCLGRYYHRVRREPVVAQHIWRELGERFMATSWAPGAWSWYGKAQASLGRTAFAASALEGLAKRPGAPVALLKVYAYFVKRHTLKAHHARVLKQLKEALSEKADTLTPDDRKALESLALSMR